LKVDSGDQHDVKGKYLNENIREVRDREKKADKGVYLEEDF